MAIDYKGYYEKKLEQGEEYQDFAADVLHDNGIVINYYCSKKYQYKKGESRSGIEVKLDDRMKKTGNIYIEYAEKRPWETEYKPSGIMREDNTWLYVVGDYSIIYIFSKNYLKRFKDHISARHVETNTSKGFLIAEQIAKQIADKVIEVDV